LRVLKQSVDTATSAGRAFFGMLAVFAQFEIEMRRERQAEGIVRAKNAGVYKGAKPRIDLRRGRRSSGSRPGTWGIAHVSLSDS
jgi:DNA invertase Pin-like site-specific DNA recombinase